MEIEWQNVRKVLIVRLRSIGDTVLTTPSLVALREFLPDAQIDIVLEDWVAPVLSGFDQIDSVLQVSKDAKDRVSLARKIRKERYDVAFNFHGGTTATFFVRASGARHRVGNSSYSYSFLYNHLLTSAAAFWKKEHTHSAEQQLALLGFVGVPVKNKPKTRLSVTREALASIEKKLSGEFRKHGEFPPNESDGISDDVALLHPTAAFDTKQWAPENFAKVAEHLNKEGIRAIAVGTEKERDILETLKKCSDAPILTFDSLTLPEIAALASRAKLFVGNDSGIAHIAAAVQTPSVVIFGSSNRSHWRPWTDAPSEIVYKEMSCQPCAGYVCEEFDEPRCILGVEVKSVNDAVNSVLKMAR